MTNGSWSLNPTLRLGTHSATLCVASRNAELGNEETLIGGFRRSHNVRERLQLFTVVIISFVLTASIIYNMFRQAPPVAWTEIILILVIVFVAIGDKISKLVISPQEVSIEQQTTEQMVEKLEKDIQEIDDFVEQDRPADGIVDIVDDTLEHPRDTWSRLLLIRMTLRRLLRKLADANRMDVSATASISSIASTFRRQGIIDEGLADQVEKIRSATFVVEWGAGEQPDLKDIKFTLENYTMVFDALKNQVRECRS